METLIKNTAAPSVEVPRLVRRWGDTDYPIIARMKPPFDLVAHPNGPAITDGNWISVMDIHYEDSEEHQRVKREAQDAWRKYSWPLLRGNFYPPNNDGGQP